MLIPSGAAGHIQHNAWGCQAGSELEKIDERGTHNPLGSAYLPLQML